MFSFRHVRFLWALKALMDLALCSRSDSVEGSLHVEGSWDGHFQGFSDGPFRYQKGLNPLVSYPVTLQDAQSQDPGSPVWSMRRFGDPQVMRSLESVVDDSEGDGVGVYPKLKQKLFNNLNLADGQPDDANNTKAVRLWNEFLQLVFIQKQRSRGRKTAAIFPTHPLFKPGETLHESAQHVRADFPIDFPTLLVKRWLDSEDGLTLDKNIFNQPDCGFQGYEFVNGRVALGAIIGWAVATVSPVAFATKWHIGRPRPEEVAWALYKTQPTEPENVKKAVRVINFLAGQDRDLSKEDFTKKFTAYDEGSPYHPSYPAMHSAASSLSAWAEIVGHLTDTQRDEARLLDFTVAFLRTVAGVHFASDNRAGLALGQEVVRKNLPEYLADAYSCSSETKDKIKNYVEDKLVKIAPIDWAVWSPENYNPPWCNDGKEGDCS